MESKAIDNWHRLSNYITSFDRGTWGFSKTELLDCDAVKTEIINRDSEYDKKLILECEQDFNNYFFYSSEDKRNIVKHYIFEFIESNELMSRYYDDYFFDDEISVHGGVTFRSHCKGKQNRNQEYFKGLEWIMNDIFGLIQKFCFLSKIDYFEVCSEIGFDNAFIDCSFTISKDPVLQLESDRFMNRINNQPDFHPETIEGFIILKDYLKANPPIQEDSFIKDLPDAQKKHDLFVGKMEMRIKTLLKEKQHTSQINSNEFFSEIPDQEHPKLIEPPESFQSYFIDKKNSEKYATFCKSVFGILKRGKADAMMTCILTAHELITIPNRGRSRFFIAWHSFINAELPKNNNFGRINNYISDLGVNGFCFINEDDIDYLNFDNKFCKTFKLNPIR